MKMNIRKPKKKGFTMVEMLVVIAIIAILVAVIIPIVQHSTVKSSAAANAANLRSIEGKIEAMRLLDTSGFKSFVRTNNFITELESHPFYKAFEFLLTGEQRLKERYNTLTASNGSISIPNTRITVTDIPFSKGLTAKRANSTLPIEIDDGFPMQIYFTETVVIATYQGYSKEDFADIAEDGIWDGGNKHVNTDPDVGLFGCVLAGGHSFGPDCKCENCGKYGHSDSEARAAHEAIHFRPVRLGLTDEGNCRYCNVHREHRNNNVDHACKYSECKYLFDDDSRGKCFDRNSDAACDHCGAVLDHACKDELKITYNDWGRPTGTAPGRDHKCDFDACDKTLGGDCMAQVTNISGQAKHTCDYCGKQESCPDTAPEDHYCDNHCTATPITTCEDSDGDTLQSSDPQYATHHACGVCGNRTEHNFTSESAKCSSCGLYKQICDEPDCNNKPRSRESYCNDHRFEHNCSVCNKKYRDSNYNDSGASGCTLSTHPKCQYTHPTNNTKCSNNITTSGSSYCSSHAVENTCDICNTKWRTQQEQDSSSCPNKNNHPQCDEDPCSNDALYADGDKSYCATHRYGHTCKYTDGGCTASWRNNQASDDYCSAHERYHTCSICNATYRDNKTGSDSAANCTRTAHPKCSDSKCSNKALYNNNGYGCANHRYSDECPLCGSYRDSNSSTNGASGCPNTNHPKCAECNTAKATGTDAGNYYCSDHIEEKTCGEDLKTGGKCGWKYRGSSCPNSDNHDEDCITADTLITLADGNQKRVDQMTGDELLLVWNHETGAFDIAPVAYVIDHGKHLAEQDIIRLVFSNGTDVKIVSEHNFFDVTLNRYVPITSANAESFIGHTFVGIGADGSSLERFDLVAVERYVEETYIYDLVSYKHLNCFTNNVLSGCAYIEGLLNIYDIDPDTMAYDAEKMQQDIAEYGLMDYSVLAPYISEYVFDMHNCSALQVGMGKDVITQEEIFALIDLFYSLVP